LKIGKSVRKSELNRLYKKNLNYIILCDLKIFTATLLATDMEVNYLKGVSKHDTLHKYGLAHWIETKIE